MGDEPKAPAMDLKQLMARLTRLDKLISVLGLLAAVICFFPWLEMDFGGDSQTAQLVRGLREMAAQLGGNVPSATVSGLGIWSGVLLFLLLLGTVGLIVAHRLQVLPWPERTLRAAPMFAAAVALVLWILAIVQRSVRTEQMKTTAWIWIELVALLCIAGLAYLRMKAAPASTPDVSGPTEATGSEA